MKRRNFWLWYGSLPKVNDMVVWAFDKDNEKFPGPFKVMDRMLDDQYEAYYVLKQIFNGNIISINGYPALFHWGTIKLM